ncbi:MAG: ABC transporter ATP-binding protein [Nitrospiraceae bacterium]|nr:ABC transporter ATP-binding protein [Nitrospiraceae bacterium]
MPLIDVNGLNIYFDGKTPVQVVKDVSFQIEKGEVFGLAGESGSGKSMTALSILGLLPGGAKARGSINFNGTELTGLSPERMRSIRGKEISMVFQEPMTSLNPVLRVGYQIREALQAHMNISKKEADERAVSLLRDVRIPAPEDRARDYPHQLSGGMRQRVMIAMAIACGPSLLIADEPTTALDVTVEAQILDLIDGLVKDSGKNMSVLLVTHDLGILAEHATNVAVMYAGRIVEMAPVRAIFETPGHPYTIGLLESIPQKGKRGRPLKPIPGAVPPPYALPPGCKFSDRCFFKIPRCTEAEPELRPAGDRGTGPRLARCIRTEELQWRPS